MATETLKDKNHNTIGFIETDSQGRQTLKDKNHNTKGYYDSKSNVTKDKNHNTIGQGNLLASLLYS
jgi:hypothetical protein